MPQTHHAVNTYRDTHRHTHTHNAATNIAECCCQSQSRGSTQLSLSCCFSPKIVRRCMPGRMLSGKQQLTHSIAMTLQSYTLLALSSCTMLQNTVFSCTLSACSKLSIHLNRVAHAQCCLVQSGHAQQCMLKIRHTHEYIYNTTCKVEEHRPGTPSLSCARQR